MKKVGQVHFIWTGDFKMLQEAMPGLRQLFIEKTKDITRNMERRGGGILDIELVDMSEHIDNYYQIKVLFDKIVKYDAVLALTIESHIHK